MSKIIFLLLITLLSAAVYAQTCPNNCSGNGRCYRGTCSCNTFYSGVDCSLRVEPLLFDVVRTDSVQRFSWRFYNFTLNAGEAFALTVNQTQTAHDIDVYINTGTVPDFVNYVMSDTTTDSVFTLSLDTPVTTKTFFYVGVFAFTGDRTDFSLKLVSTRGCPSGCNGNGDCVSGACVCKPGFTGETCSDTVRTITLGQTVQVSVAEGEWIFYTYRVQSTLNFNLHITQASGDVDVYVRKGAPPTFFEYDYVDTTTDTSIDMFIYNPSQGNYYFGFYGYQASDFTFNLDRSERCLNQCSKHGLCRNSRCTCNSGFSGDACETRTEPLTSNQIVDGFVSKHMWNYFRYNSFTANSFVIELNQSEPTMDCDIYVNRGENPTLTNFLFSDVSLDNTAHLRIDDANTGEWFIGVYGYSECRYTMRVYESTACPGGCGRHGICNDNGRCVCTNGWVGQNCEAQSSEFLNGGTVVGEVVAPGEWKYYSITISSTSQLNAIAKEFETEGMIWLFISANQHPTLLDHEKADTETKSGVHRISLEFSSPRSGVQYFIGVYGAPYAQRDITYDLTIFYTPF